METDWSEECVSLIQNFFETILNTIRSGEHEKAKRFLAMLHEPNETHLGLSRGEQARGRAVAGKLANRVFDSLIESEAVATGMLSDLEDTILMVPGISSDIVSDISTNIIRKPLIEYTQRMCAEHDIPMEDEVASGPLWDPQRKSWTEGEHVNLPVIADKKLLLIPKSIVRIKMEYDEEEYYRHYILPHLQEEEISNPNSELIKLLKRGPHVYKKDVDKKIRKDEGKKNKGMKKIIIEQTLKNPSILAKYRREKSTRIRPPLSHEEFSELIGTESPNWSGLLGRLQAVTPGRDAAHDYHMAAKDLLTALFYPHLDHPVVEQEIDQETQRIDIKFSNTAKEGFFWWLSQNYFAPNVFIECKNYVGEIGNPEIHQMLGRFSRSRGEFGIITCRTVENRERCRIRCRAIADGQSKYILVLDDRDISRIVEAVQNSGDPQSLREGVLKERFDELIM